ncbi:putative disease resistance protein RGA3 isoform X1 [Juglans microcarpa x Juglans regia]|uniref:putative disease resistance protein RGA3 isoform X1 n=1 Tax=Juglans microcarpa x Juglans regia TaxID=2249226 RepID=UPI001B7F07B6|nr:putative disease resistance protein RGA3 isoform X1 [Juglans microcarpa x Juglans regia]
METLVHNFRKEIGGKKYLIVLDDVWNEDVKKWDDLKVLLEVGASGSRILVTTRSAKVARITQTIEPYSLQGLDSQKSWSLFKQVAFEKGQEPENSRIVALGKEIVEKCYGLPLVIKTIGRLLFLENSEAGWFSFKNKKMPKIKENDILPTLKLSYDQLPSHLKQCFAYCSIFPKDYEMEKSTLINLWIAQGFIKLSNQNECLEDAGHDYFMDLLWRSFFQEAKMDDLGNVIASKMHDLMHDLAMSVAGSLITRLESKEKIISDQKTRHVSVVDNIEFSFVVPTSSSKASRIRTLLSLGEFKDLQESSTSCDAIFSSLKSLRVLDLHGRPPDLVPSSICKLKHLRDLDLSYNDKIEKLPDSISRLQNLYTLRLYGCQRLKELPRGISKLVNLRHLYNDECQSLTYMPRGLGQLKNLQTLSKFVVHSDSAPKDSGRLSELNRLNSLRGKLEISGLRSREEDVANLKEKEHLQVLTLRWRSRGNVINAGDEMALEGSEPHPNLKKLKIENYGGVRVPMWLLSLTNLVDLSLSGCSKLKYLPPLSRLPFLKRISLSGLEEIEYVSDCSDNNELSSSAFFPSLEVIEFFYCPNLKGWWRRSDSYNVDVNTTGNALLFPRLSKLEIWYCPLLTPLPMFPHLEEELLLRDARWKAVQQTITNASSSASSTPIAFSSPPLSKLKNIYLQEIDDLQTLPEDRLQNLISLQHLMIIKCPKLKSLSQGVQYLTALQNLELIDCPMLNLGNDEHVMQWKGLNSLISLEIDDIPKLVSLPLGLQHVTTLRELRISDCSSLMTIPEWICNWASLERFTISTCSGLTSLPEAMSRLTSLKVLTIHDCPILLQRCEQDGGEDWPKIAHIPKRHLS